jgi:ribonuclease Z
MEVVLLGTGNPVPDPQRAGAATLVRAGGRLLLVDCGRGVTMRLAAAGTNPATIDALLVTHLHSDHVWSLNDLLTTRWVLQPVEQGPMPVVGPAGTAAFVEATLASMAPDTAYRLEHHDDLTWEPRCDVTEVADGPAWTDGSGVSVTSAVVDHGVVRPALSFRIEAEGRSVVVAGDTRPSPAHDELCAGADVYVQTVFRRPLVEAIPSRRFLDIMDYHSSTEEAAATAARAGVGTLVLTHLIPAPSPGTEGDWADDVRRHFDGEVVVGTT